MSASYVNKDPKVKCPACTRVADCFHHVKTRGAGGSDEPWNLMPLCQAHHNEIHMKGNCLMAAKHPNVGLWLVSKGWELDAFRGKWLPPRDEQLPNPRVFRSMIAKRHL